MKCYYHHDRDAFGICSNCGKGLCLECMQEVNNQVVCKNKKCAQTTKFLSLWQMITLFLILLAIILVLVD